MPLRSFDQLFERADAIAQPVPIAVAGAADGTVLEALRIASDWGWITPFVVGTDADIRQTASASGVGLDGFTIVDSADPAATAVSLVRSQRARLLMKGQIATPALLKALLDPALGLRSERVICQVVVMELAGRACDGHSDSSLARPANETRRFLLADTGICIAPTLPQKIDILAGAVEVARALGAECPRVALLTATECVSAAMPETEDAAELERRNRSGEITGCVVRGPLSFDLAFDAEAAAKKKLQDAEFGLADILLFPNLLSANLTVKAIMYTAECRFGGVLCGAACPVVFMSRADTTATRLNSLALALTVLS